MTGAFPPREADIQKQIIELLTSVGAYVLRTSQSRASRVTPGLPDLIALLPRRKGILLIEVKSAHGKQSDAQIICESRAQQAGVPYVCGGLQEVRAALSSLGVLLPVDGRLGEPAG